MDDRHTNLFDQCEDLIAAYDFLRRDQDQGLNKRAFWSLVFFVLAGTISASVVAGSDLWKWLLFPILAAADRAAWHAIEVSNRNYCMHALTMLIHLQGRRRP